jgi:tetratricopeptide (TPR) repeat protein/tRNA A-37 threonylcarbamoyl transferase component Bud32
VSAEAPDFFDRVRADLAASRRRRLGELAVARGFLTPSKLDEILSTSGAIDAALRPSQLDVLLRELDDPAAAARDPLASRYEIGEKLGEGAVSIVHRGIDRELGRTVALKFLREGLLSLEKVRERFYREARSLARMDHPNVIKVHDVGISGQRPYLVMELVEEGSLTRLLAREPRGSRSIIGLLEQAARGVHHAHERGIVHRDLKPDNILVAAGPTAKVADFGLAHLVESGTSLTRTGTVLGTPLYMAPEQVHGRGELTPRTDVYALGAILYQALTGRPPHDAETVSQVYDMILSEDPQPPRSMDPSLPRELEAVVLKAMEKEPGRRYESAAAFAEDLRRWLAGEPVEARPVSTAARAWRRVTRHRLRLVTAALVLAAIAVALLFWSRSRGQIEESNARAARIETATRLLEEANRAVGNAYAATYTTTLDAASLLREAEQARSLIEKALAAAPDYAPAHFRAGEVWEITGYYDRAETSFRRAAELNPRFGPAHYRLGRTLLWQGYLASLNMWTVPDPADRERGERLARDGAAAIEAARAEGSEFEDPILREVAAAMIAYLRNEPAAVERLCAEGISRHGRQRGVEEFHWLRGLMQKKSADQLRSFNEALAIRPKFPLALYSRAWVPGGGGPAGFSEALRYAPGFSEALIFRGSAYLNDPGTIPLAVADFDELLRRGVHLAPAYNGRGFARLKMKDYPGAIADFTEAIRVRPEGYHLPWIGRAEARLLNGEAREGIPDAERALAIEKGDGKYVCWSLLGRCKAAAGDKAGALEALKKAGAVGAPYLRELEKSP